MVKVRASTLIAGYGRATAMSAIGASAMQMYGPGAMVWAKRGLILRNAPFTIENPHLGQIETRLHFASLAHAARGRVGLDPETGLPGAAAEIRKRMPGFRAPTRLPRPYPSQVKRTFHVEADLKRLYEAKRRVPAVRAPPAIVPF